MTMSEPRVALVTGASSGIGFETARVLVAAGLRVIGTRLPGETVGDPPCETLELDLRSDESVAACVAGVLERTGRMDILINNAGIGLVGTLEETSLEEARALFGVNYFGAVRMIRAALPVMREQRSGTIVNVGSVAGNIGVPFEAHYCAAKAALESMTKALRYEVGPLGIRVTLVAPGFVRTGFYASLGEAVQRMGVYDAARDRAVSSFRADGARGTDPRRIALVVARAALSRRPRLRYWAGSDARLYGFAQRIAPDWLTDWIMRRRF
jgi:NAD(P)-dependent dehydrogenase (short-subunit alcohol dehydrogenase family)